MRDWTERYIDNKHVVKARDINEEMDGLLREFNGGLDQNNMPLQSVAESHIAEPNAISNVPNLYSNVRSTYGQSESYHYTRLGIDYTLDPDVDGGLFTKHPINDGLRDTWMKFSEFTTLNQTGGSVCEFDAVEGMVHAHFHVDMNRRISYVSRNDGATTYPELGKENTMAFGLFANGVLVADSGPIYPRRTTIDLPCSFAVSSGYLRLDAMFLVKTFSVRAAGVYDGVTWSFAPVGAAQYASVIIHGLSIFARNEYR